MHENHQVKINQSVNFSLPDKVCHGHLHGDIQATLVSQEDHCL